MLSATCASKRMKVRLTSCSRQAFAISASTEPSPVTHTFGATPRLLMWPGRNSAAMVALESPKMCRSQSEMRPPRAEHKIRKVAKQTAALPFSKRTPPDHAVWVPLAELPACSFHQAWYEHASFESAVKHYGAKVVRGSWAGPGCRCFYLQLTSGRYACIESRRDHSQTVIVSLEVDTRRAGRNSGGKVYVRDIEEILAPMGGAFKMPSANLFIGWSTDP